MIHEEIIEAAAIGMYGSKWNDPRPNHRPGEKMKDVWREYASKALSAALPILEKQIRADCAEIAKTYRRDASFDDSAVGAQEHQANQENIARAILGEGNPPIATAIKKGG